jgi:tRNA A-37 threonylcarbamoyl transferase component Bud32
MANLVGQSLGRYHVIEQLGEGGMAVVYKAFDTRLERPVALKVIRTEKLEEEQFLARFEREAKALAKLTHPNIVHINDFGEHEGIPFLVMDYIPAGTLKQRLGTPIHWGEAARFLAPVARALEYAHQRGIIHRDIKPSNILVTESGEPMLTDFGIAKMLQGEQAVNLTSSGVGLGTPEYMSPEQVMGSVVDGRSDVYSLGTVLYEMVTGRTPYKADTPMAIAIKQVNDPLPRPRQYVPSLPAQVEQVIFKALGKQADDRYLEMGAFAAALEKMAENAPADARKATITGVPAPGIALVEPLAPKAKFSLKQRIKKFYKENTTCVIIVAILLVVISCGCLILGAWQERKNQQAAATQTAEAAQPALVIKATETKVPPPPVEPTPIEDKLRVSACKFIPAPPTFDAIFINSPVNFVAGLGGDAFFFTENRGKVEFLEKGAHLVSGPESAAVLGIMAKNPRNILSLRMSTSSAFSILLIDKAALNEQAPENKRPLIKVALQVEKNEGNNAGLYTMENDQMNPIGTFTFPMEKEVIVVFDIASHKFNLYDARGESIFGTQLPESILAGGSYWIVGDPAGENIAITNLLVRQVCYLDAER